VNKDYSPTPPGEVSHTVLLTNLTNRVQPILRYDLGDSVLQRPDPCPCGSPLPAVRVRGRAAEVLVFPGQKGGEVRIVPLVFSTLLDRFRSIEQYQIVQTSPDTLHLRLRLGEDADPETVWNRVFEKITALLKAHEAGDIEILLSQEPPVPTPAGKYPTVIPFKTE
ncbi:MAG: phenylacetate--CoA ligase family protein, partial [Desulfobia sp.]